MALEDELRQEVVKKFRDVWNIRNGNVVPDESSVNLGNSGVKIEATVLYSDLSDSTLLVDNYKPEFAAEIYGTFLRCASRIIRANGGTITSFDGDRVMAIYMGESKEERACWTAFGINRAMIEIIRPALYAQYPQSDYTPHHTTGIDNSEILVVKDGIRGGNDLIWVGRAANYAAKLCALDHNYQTRITAPIFEKLSGSLLTTVNSANVWEFASWKGINIYRSSCFSLSI